MAEEITETQFISLPPSRKADWTKAIKAKIYPLKPGPVLIDSADWQLGYREIKRLKSILENSGLRLICLNSDLPETLVSASALGIQTHLNITNTINSSMQNTPKTINERNSQKIFFQKGTLRSGETLEVQGDVLLLGDVNPGAHISASGHVMVWGRLRGVAHAGKEGNKQATITALQLRPLQLRISEVIARGPEEKPEEGLAEEASLEKGIIVIKPASIRAFADE